ATTVATLDGFGRSIKVVEDGITTTTGFDAQGRHTFASYPFTTSEKRTTFTYDALGRVRTQTNPDATSAQYTYGPGTLTIEDEDQRDTVHTVQAFGDPDDTRLTAVKDAKGDVWKYSYNAKGR